MRHRFLMGLAAALSSTTAFAQYPPPQYAPPPQYPPPQYAPPPQYGAPPQYGYGAPPQYAPPPAPARSTGLEVGFLYGTAVAWGVGTGVWLDAEIPVQDPGLRFIAPVVLGLAAPAGVLVLDRVVYKPAMPEGMPSAIATGMLVGAGEGLGVASYQWVSSTGANEWGFRGLARAEFIGSTIGGVGGYAFYRLVKPKPKHNVLVSSGIVWGSVLGSEFGAGASNGDWGLANDDMSLGGLIGFNIGLAATVTLSTVWTPSWNQLGWMWGGLALGTAVSLPVYIFYAGGDHDPRRGLIFQGVAGLLGLGAGAFIGKPEKKGAIVENEEPGRPRFARVLGGGLFPVQGGAGAQVYGQLW